MTAFDDGRAVGAADGKAWSELGNTLRGHDHEFVQIVEGAREACRPAERTDRVERIAWRMGYVEGFLATAARATAPGRMAQVYAQYPGERLDGWQGSAPMAPACTCQEICGAVLFRDRCAIHGPMRPGQGMVGPASKPPPTERTAPPLRTFQLYGTRWGRTRYVEAIPACYGSFVEARSSEDAMAIAERDSRCRGWTLTQAIECDEEPGR